MKKPLLLLIIVFQYTFVYSQSLVVTGSTDVPSTDPCLQTSSYLTVKNVSLDTLNVLCEKVIIDTALGTENSFCWGANCYGSNIYVSSSHNTLDPGEGDNTDFTGYYDAYCNTAHATVQYCFYPDTDPSDKTCITITYNGSLASISSQPTIVGFFPNPANEYTNIRYNSFHESKFKLLDILGNQVMNIELDNSGEKKITLAHLPKGLYFGNLISNDKIVQTKKLIVK